MGASKQNLRFLSRLAVSVAVFGSVLGLAQVSVQSVFAVLGREEARESDESIRKSFSNRDLFTSVEERIGRHEAMISRLKSPLAKREEQRALAVSYEELGSRSFAFNQLSRAEEAYQKCVALDPENPQYLSDLANLYASAAVRQAEAKHRVNLLRDSSKLWQNAAVASREPSQRVKFRQGAASALFDLASELAKAGLSAEARRELQTARDFAEDGSQLETQINQLLNQTGN